ncbi:GABA transporter 1 [Chlorella sorokiniana]|uniref:GABA transporter 1 n=1 Tax=Chlorella sorokiniana TaxID=3076 RepID=A0A2P6TUN8_CHLSO|nr:GABA transporter 1 [Chlorella sorokiniana]|eukprot:PRW57761.1 GABA transporter 1 [Chlorella sorokiniana]
MAVVIDTLGEPPKLDDKLPPEGAEAADAADAAAAEAGAEAGLPPGEERLRVWPSFASTRFASKRVQLESHLTEPSGSWLRALYILVSSTSQPGILTLPYALASLGWAGGILVLLCTGAYTLLANVLLAKLHHYDGRRHIHYRGLAKEIMGPRHKWAYYSTFIPQFVVILGCGIANLVLAADCLQQICGLYYTNDDCPVAQYQWTIILGATLVLLAQLPDLGSSDVLTASCSAFLVFYSIASMALAGVQGGGRDADYSLVGSRMDKIMNGFNALGMFVFMFTNPIVPEIQATLAADPATGSSYRPMRRALVVSYSGITALFLCVSIVGYWAYGSSVGSFLLAMSSHPKWLVITCNIMIVIQLLVGEQVFEYILYESMEVGLVELTPKSRVLHKVRQDARGRRVLVPSRITMLLVRVTYIAIITAIAAAFPFFTQLMGAVGALGFTPLCLILPAVLFLMARGSQLAPWQRWGLGGLAATFTGLGVLAAVGAVRSIVVAIQQHAFFS